MSSTSEPLAYAGPEHEVLRGLTLAHGIHGLLLRVADQWVCPVRQLDFKLNAYVQDCTAIPEDRKTEYLRALMDTGLTLHVVGRGGCYNIPLDGWYSPDHEKYKGLREELEIVGCV